MTENERDRVLEAAVSELRTLRPVDAETVARVVRASADGRQGDMRQAAGHDSMGRRWRIGGIVLTAMAAGVVGFMVRGSTTPPAVEAPPESAAAAPASASAPRLEPVSARDLESRAVPTQFVFESRGARRVSLVGDFNGWSPRTTPMTRHQGTSLWAVTLPVAPGRHLYAFMVDDSIFTLDPREPAATDNDIGAQASVVIVGRP